MARKPKKPAKPVPRRSSDEEFVLNFFIGAALFALSTVAFWQAYHAGFIWDDDQLLTANPQVHAANGWWTLWLKPATADYFPLTSITLWIQYQLAQPSQLPLSGAPFHTANIIFHAITVVLTWQTLKRLKIPGAAVAAAIFAVHPICVESVAWISERKNTVSQIFFLLSIINYVRYQERGPLWRYIAAVLCFTLSLLAKTAVVMLPFILLLLTWWRYRDLLAMRKSYELADNPRETGILVWSCAAVGEALGCTLMVLVPALSASCAKIVGAFGQDTTGDSLGLTLMTLFVTAICAIPLGAAGYFGGLQIKKHKVWNRFASFEVIRMIPFFLAALILGAVTVYFQNVRAISDEVIPIAPHLWQRACSACFAAGFYLYSAIWPFNIIEIYPEWHRYFPTWEKFPTPHFAPPNKEAIPYYIQVLPGLAIAGILVWCWMRRAQAAARATLTGLGIYFIAMLPALGFTTMSYMRLTLVADHFQYISIIAVIALVVAAGFTRSFNPIYLYATALILAIITYINWGLTQDNHVEEILWIVGIIALGLVPRHDDSTWKFVFYAYLALLFLCFSIVTFNQAALYQDEGTLWGATLAKNPDSWQAHNHYGAWLYTHGDIKGAAPHFHAATVLKPENPESHNNLGLTESAFGEHEEALKQFIIATTIKDDPSMDTNLGNEYLKLNRFDDAIRVYDHALDLQPNNAGAWCNRGVALMHEGRVNEAVVSFMNSLQFSPAMNEGRQGLSAALRALGIDPESPIITGTYPFDVNKAIELLHMAPMPQMQQ